MKRRQFLYNTLQKTSLLSLTPSLMGTCQASQMGRSASVIVIGAGLSGLAAAQKLRSSGLAVRVLEAQDQIGGRTRSNRTLGFAFDEGASWIHGSDGNPLTKLAQKAGMTTFHTDDDNRKAYDLRGAAIAEATFEAAESQLERILGTLSQQGNTNLSFEAVFNALYPQYANSRFWRFLLSNVMTFDLGDLNKLSSLLYDEGEAFGGLEKIATNGYDTLGRYLATGLDIQLNQQVTAVDYSTNPVKVSHKGHVSEADFVLVTVPLGVLKKNTLNFIPKLPTEKQTAIAKVGINCVNKFLLTWPKAFWDDVQYIAYTPEAKDKFNYFLNIKKIHPTANALLTFAYADYARLTETMSDAQVTSEIMAHLRDIYGSATPNPTQLLRTKWHSHPHVAGSYSFPAVETLMRHFDDLAQSLNDRVFFGGEHTESRYFSTAHGAYLSGLREAQKILDAL
jgi:monoamine oxidase